MKCKLSDILGILIMGFIVFGIIFAIYSFIGASIFSFLGVKFTSIKALFISMLIFCILSTIIELFTDGFIQIITEFRNLTKKSIFILKLFVSVPTKVIIILLADMLSKNVEINFLAALLGATLMFLIEYKTDESLDKINTTLEEKAIDDMQDALDKFEKEHKKDIDDNNNKPNKEK